MEEYMLNEKQQQAFANFSKTIPGSVLDKKTNYLVKTAVAIALSCHPWMEHLFGGAEENGITQEELGAVVANVMVVSAGSAKNKAEKAFEDVNLER